MRMRLRTPCRLAAVTAFAVAVAVQPAIEAATDEARPPHLRRRGTATELVVGGKPFLVLGGELGNSSGEPDYLRPFWPRLEALHLNTVLAPVYWDVMEPREGRFDFSQMDGLVRDARAHDRRLVLLWFASWKNSMSCYAPSWVKTDLTRFPRSRDSQGRDLEILSPFVSRSRDADARAFAALMRHVRETDGEQQTVIMVQVENEIGMIPEARDRTALADELFAAPVPAELLRHLEGRGDELAPELRSLWTRQGRRTSGTWPEVFGDGPAGAEIFMAWHFARYVEGVASAGKAEYPLPMYVNAALVRPGALPGQYPSAGPLPHLIDVWRAGAPSIDFLAPDIYFPTFPEWCRLYTRSGNPLFVPEALRTPDASVRVLYAVGQHDALGFAPFAIESIPEPAASRLAESYDLLGRLAPVLDEQRGSGSMAGLLPPGPDGRQPQQVPLGDLVLSVSYERRAPQSLADGGIVPPPPEAESLPAGGLVIASAPDELVFVGIGVTVTFAAASPSRQTVGILSVEEVNFAEGRWSHVRWVNGDQTHQGRHVRLEPGRLAIQRVRLYRY